MSAALATATGTSVVNVAAFEAQVKKEFAEREAATAAAIAKALKIRKKAKIGGEGILLTLDQLLLYSSLASASAMLLFLLWWKPWLGVTSGVTVAGLLSGLLYSYLYYSNTRRKDEAQQLLSMDPGLKGCGFLLGKVPSWVQLTDREKMEWLNKLLEQLWPYYDRAVCRAIKEAVEPVMEQKKLPGVMKRMFFQELTFGDAPFRVEGISVRELEDEIDMELDVRWCGDANIVLGIDMPAGGEVTRLNPKIQDIVFVATFRVILKPLVKRIPGFAAIALALKTPPIIKYRLDFGRALGGSVITSPIVNFVNALVIDGINSTLLWPNRVTVPILGDVDDEIALEIERLNGRQRGVVKVEVISAKDLKSYDSLTGKSDPFVELYTTTDHRCSTRHISNNLTPVWNETFYLPVLEKDQVLRLEMFDYDAVNVLEGLSAGLQVWKGVSQAVGAKEFMGRAALPLAPVLESEGRSEDMWLPLGKGEWTNLQGPGKGEGYVRLSLQYRAVENIKNHEVAKASKGLLFVTVMRANKLVSATGSKLSCFVTVKVGKTEFKTTTLKKCGRSPVWRDKNKFTFYDVELKDNIAIAVKEPGLMNDELGRVDVPVVDVMESQQFSRWTRQQQAGYMFKMFKLTDGDGGELQLELELVPHW